MLATRPIEADELPEVGLFLHRNLKARVQPAQWISSLNHSWSDVRPNFGMQLRDNDALVGVCCAIYSDQMIDGKVERFCNPHSWCVLPSHRSSGIGVVLSLLKQRGYHFTMFTPNAKVTQIFLGLRFRLLDDRLLYFPNVPSLSTRGNGRFIETDPGRIEQRLAGPAARDFSLHRSIPWLHFIAFGAHDDVCLTIYKTGRWKKLPCARIIYVSNPGALARHGHLLRHHLCATKGLLVSRIEARFVESNPPLSHRAIRTQPKLVLTKTLEDRQVLDTYSELVALDV